MATNTHTSKFVQDVKQQILHSRYQAAKTLKTCVF